MPVDCAVVNASPIICLSKAGLIDLLEGLFREIIIPREVLVEIGPITLPSSLHAKAKPPIVIPTTVVGWDLGSGESAVIAWCLQSKSHWAIIDDREACRCADTLGCRHTGTIGVLVLAKKQGLIKQIKPMVQRLADAGLWMSERFRDDIVRLNGE